jgi:hypothetical protein
MLHPTDTQLGRCGNKTNADAAPALFDWKYKVQHAENLSLQLHALLKVNNRAEISKSTLSDVLVHGA